MQLASHGARTAIRNPSNFIPRTANSAAANSSRSIHTPSFARIQLRVLTPGTTQKLFTQTRSALARFVAHLTAPGLRVPNAPSVARSFHGAAHAQARATIQQGFSFPVRTALSRPLQSHFLPRAPTVVPRSMTQVGLGTARNFSSGRPIFQNLVENVPVAGRAFYEADWEIKMRKEREMMKRPKNRQGKKSGSEEMLKPRVRNILLEKETAAKQRTYESELEQYFATPVTPDVTTCLLIPLAPTPTTRAPLPPFTSDHPSLLPLPALASLHASHSTHALRVSSLFSRLDAANVWERGVLCSAYSHGTSTEGVCTVLKVEFVGWTKAEVRSVIGESGSGWCVLEEVRRKDSEEDLFSETSSVLSGEDEGSRDSVVGMDPARSFVLPTLDFSSSFLATSSLSPAPSRSLSRTPSDIDLFSYANSESDSDSWSDESSSYLSSTDSQVDPPSINGWFGFSSEFARRTGAEQMVSQYEPRESVFY